MVGGEEEAEQPRKKPKLDSDRVKRIIATKSSHDWEVQEVCVCVCEYVHVCTCVCVRVCTCMCVRVQ